MTALPAACMNQLLILLFPIERLAQNLCCAKTQRPAQTRKPRSRIPYSFYFRNAGQAYCIYYPLAPRNIAHFQRATL